MTYRQLSLLNVMSWLVRRHDVTESSLLDASVFCIRQDTRVLAVALMLSETISCLSASTVVHIIESTMPSQ